MLQRLLQSLMADLFERYLKARVRRGSIQAVKLYIQGVGVARMGLLGIVGLTALAAVLVGGILLIVAGGIQLLPITVEAGAITLMVIGFVLALASGITLAMVFSEKRWLRASQAYVLMDAVTAPWPGSLPPNPRDAFARAKRAEATAAEDREAAAAAAMVAREEVIHERDMMYAPMP